MKKAWAASFCRQKNRRSEVAMGPRPKHSWGLLRSGTFSHLSHVAVSRASSWAPRFKDLLKFRIRRNRKCFTEQSHSGHWLQMQTPGPSQMYWIWVTGGWAPGFGIYNNCCHPDSNAVECFRISFCKDTGSLTYMPRPHTRGWILSVANSENLPPGNILSAACKTPQAVQVDSMEKR